MPQQPAISVIIPAHNVARYLRQAAESVLAQTRQDFEVIVVDDGSTDGTPDVLRDLRDARLRMLRQSRSGSASARNAGIALAAGPYIAFLDADDLWAPDKLERQAGFLEAHAEADLVFSASLIIDESGADTGRTVSLCSGAIPFSRLLAENCIGNGSSAMMRREALDRAGHLDPQLPAAADYDLWLRMALLRPNNIFGIPQILTFYRRRPGQVSSDWRLMERAWCEVFEKMRRLAPQHASSVEAKARGSAYRALSATAYENGQYREARSLFRKALRCAPLTLLADRRTWLHSLALAATRLPEAWHQTLQAAARSARSALRPRGSRRVTLAPPASLPSGAGRSARGWR
jgi:glycosyltransferase involved in cell wall biosynthesis